ncbi:MAG: hypothetical protein KKF44_04875 [Nanoarchaeota archaeon]|nr:hypothetical protein [Nanoarchaeota archaeon]
MPETTSVGEIIIDSLELRKIYESKRPKYDRLLNLVSLILNSALEKNNLRIHSMKQRVKDYSSFLEKVERKRYEDPLRQCTDLAGVRIICLFSSHIERLKKIIQNEFKVIEESDKRSAKKFDQFGYLSLHMLVEIPKNRSQFIEFNDLGGLVCEIQIRTILQEAWAEIEHHLNYKAAKQEKNTALLRKIFSLAGMFEVADSTFEEINSGFSKMIEKDLTTKKQEITGLDLYKFSKEHFRWYENEWDQKEERSFLKLSKEISRMNIKAIKDIENLLKKYSLDLEKYETYHKSKSNGKKLGSTKFFNPVGLIRAALAIEYGKKFDLVFGLTGYSEKLKKEIDMD